MKTNVQSPYAALSTPAPPQVHRVGGRPLDELKRWRGELPIALHAYHGYRSRPAGSGLPA